MIASLLITVGGIFLGGGTLTLIAFELIKNRKK